MRALHRIANRALALAAMIAFAGGGAQPVLAQDDSAENGEDDRIITITPDMAPSDSSRLLGGSQTLPPPDGTRITVPADRAASSAAGSGPPSVLAILAHPDDEITIAPVLARMARGGGDVTLVFVTSGDAGPGVSGMEPGAQLAELRENEARCSAFALGLPEPIFWQLGDGQLAKDARAADSAARDMEARIAALITLKQPQVVMTWGPDGGYGHADHRMVSNAVTQIIGAMDDTRPDLLYAAFPSNSETRGALPGFENWATTHPSLITDRIRYETPDLDAARHAIDCHQSQFDSQARALLAGILHQNVWQGTVYFRLAFAPAS